MKASESAGEADEARLHEAEASVWRKVRDEKSVFVVVDGKVRAKRKPLAQKKHHFQKGCWDKHSIYIE